MKGLLFFLFLTFSFQILHAQNTPKNKTKRVKSTKKKEGFTYAIGKPEDSLFVTFSKGFENSQLDTYGSDFIWLGKYYADNHFSEIVITFSKPVTHVEFELSHFNNDEYGNEKIKDFNVIDEQDIDITSTSIFRWITGPEARMDSSILNAVTLKNESNSISAERGFGGEGVSGRLIISNSKAFTKITFSHKVLYGTPNGIWINTSINYGLGTKDTKLSIEQINQIAENEVSNTAIDTLRNEKELTFEQPDSIQTEESASASTTKKATIESFNDPQSSKKLHKSIKPIENSKGFAFHLCSQEEPLKATFYKGNEKSHLSLHHNKMIWLGEFNPMEDYSTVVIVFSKPITDVTILMSEFNNNEFGSEQIQDFRFIDNNHTDITSSAKLSWTSETAGTTLFNEKAQIISAAEGRFGPDASGKLYISNTSPFTYITFTHKTNRGTPNGIYIQLEYNCPQPGNKSKAKKHSVISSSKEPVQEIPTQSIIDTISTPKELPTVKKDSVPPTNILPVSAAKEESVKPVEKTEVKPTPKKLPVAVTKPPVQKIPVKPVTKTPAPKAPVKPVAKAPVQKAPVKPVTKIPAKVTSTPNKTQPVKKAIPAPKPVVKKVTPKPPAPKPITKAKPVIKQPHTLAQIAKLNAGDKIKLERVFFKQSLAELLPESYLQLDTLVIILNQYPTLQIELQGYTDNIGNPQKNLVLSEQRVVTVKKYLVSKGIAQERLTLRGFGGSEPVAENTTEENRKLNRRVEFMIIKK